MKKILAALLLLFIPTASDYLPIRGDMRESQQYIYVLRPTRVEMLKSGFTAAEAEIQKKHEDYLDGLRREGVLLVYGRTLTTDESTFGLVIFKAVSEASARKLMENDPGVKYGLMKARLYPYRVAYLSKG